MHSRYTGRSFHLPVLSYEPMFKTVRAGKGKLWDNKLLIF